MHIPISNIHIGQKIVENIPVYDSDKQVTVIQSLKWIVTEIFPYFVKVRRYDKEGRIINNTFCLGELVQLGYEPTGGMDE